MINWLQKNNSPPLFKSFFQGGFECSTHRRSDSKRLDLIASTLHDKYSFKDYQALASHGINTVRDGLRWHLIEPVPGYYDWSSFIPMLHAARDTNTQVIWDLCHYGWPDDINIWKPEFVIRFAKFAAEVATLVKNETNQPSFYIPINEISFWSWAGGDVGYLNPRENNRGFELKQQLVRASIAAIEAIRQIDKASRFIQAEPAINISNFANLNCEEASRNNEAQYQAWDLLSGNLWPGLGGREDLLDIIGVNYYPYNQWFLDGSRISLEHAHYRSFSDILLKIYERYKKPIYIAETGTEGITRAEWFKYICEEVYAAINKGVPVEGICIYPVTDYFGWDDDRHCETGLLGLVSGADNNRPVYYPLANELVRQQRIVKET